jgi:hypothetical protein
MANRSLSVRLVTAAAGALAAAMVLGIGAAAGAGTSSQTALPQFDDPVHLDPADFSANIDNKRWPMTVGSRWVYRVTDYATGSMQRDVIKVTDRTKMIADGIEARVVHDVVRDHGKPTEVTDDWYAQDSDGNVWYFGEHTTRYNRHGHPVDNGTWGAGVDGAMPGIALPAHPKVGMSYREEYAKGVAEDQTRVLRLDAQVQTPTGHYTNVLMTEDFSPIEPKVSELKFYVKGSGQAVLAVDVSDGTDTEQLIKYTH